MMPITSKSLGIDIAKAKYPVVDPADRDPCPGCSSYLNEPFIRCIDCDTEPYLICLSCFARGFENGKHKSNHKYEIITGSFPLLEYGWSSAEEMRLLDSLSDCGAGNWSAVAKQVRTKTKHECEGHYVKCYILNARYPLPELPCRPAAKICPPIPFKASGEPCRPLPESHRAQDMAGYLAARGDFTEEYLNGAEWGIKDVHFAPDDWPVLKSLKLEMVKIYQSRLSERKRRKDIMRTHGLINVNNHVMQYLRKLANYEKELEEKLRPLMRLQHPIAHDKIFAGFCEEHRLIKRVQKLKEYRKAGITSHRVTKLYEKLKSTRRVEPYSSCLTEILSYKNDHAALLQWLHRQSLDTSQSSTLGPVIPSSRKSINPIDISDLPGVQKLSTIEKEFCESCRIVPEAFLRYKCLLVSEFERSGTLKLSQARTIVKIDVNKTRRLFDFLVKQGYVNTDSTTA
uniref:transcriptional adapter 2-alpha-like n=1 Tax=Styela clava TaxID=7725 RepID=UPI0019395A41|nr:transcriptional adapter 2-alpha-like [Styela clava]